MHDGEVVEVDGAVILRRRAGQIEAPLGANEHARRIDRQRHLARQAPLAIGDEERAASWLDRD
jgi:hypothetical protein